MKMIRFAVAALVLGRRERLVVVVVVVVVSIVRMVNGMSRMERYFRTRGMDVRM